jgi:DnaK suppressor protein
VSGDNVKLSTGERKALRAALETKRAELLRTRRENVAAVGQLNEENPLETTEGATRETELTELRSLTALERALIADIDRAIAKFDEGGYGASELSGQPIPIERLRAIPWARLTADEEERRERQP